MVTVYNFGIDSATGDIYSVLDLDRHSYWDCNGDFYFHAAADCDKYPDCRRQSDAIRNGTIAYPDPHTYPDRRPLLEPGLERGDRPLA